MSLPRGEAVMVGPTGPKICGPSRKERLLPAKTAKGKHLLPHSIPFDPQVKGNASALNPTAVNPAVGKLVLAMSRPWVLVFLFLMIVFTSQLEWKQQFGNEPEPKSSSSSKEDIGQREEVVKDKIILSQERNIQKLQELVRNLHQQLLNCKRGNINVTGMPFDEVLTKLDRMPTWED